MKVLKPLSRLVKNTNKVVSFDVETYQEDCMNGNIPYIKQKFLMGSVVSDDDKIIFWNKKDMQDYILSKKLRNSLIFATNLDFDFNILFDKYDGREFWFCEKAGKFIYIKFYGGTGERKFLDTMSYIGVGVARLGKMLNLDKLEHPSFLGQIPKNLKERRILEQYNIRDSEITYRYGKFLVDFCNKMTIKIKPTIASLGIDYWRRNHLKRSLYQEPRNIIDKHFLGSIKGGRTENFKRGRMKNLFYYDYNSMYPSRCYEGVDGEGSYPDPSSYTYLKDVDPEYIMNTEGVSRCVVNIPSMYIPPLGLRSESGKLCFPTGTLSGWWTHYELQYAVKLGCSIQKVEECISYSRLFNPFRECVDKLYELRQSYKKEGNYPMEQMVKVMMNAGLFGKFAQRINNKSECYHIDSVKVRSDGTLYVILEDGKERTLQDFKFRGNYVFDRIEIPMRVPLYIMPILASYTTGMSRVKLHKDMNKYSNNVVYCDTDSIVSLRKCYRSSNKLGELELEDTIKDAIFCKPKQYYYNNGEKDKVKIKGVSRKAVYDYSSFLDLIRTGYSEEKRFTKIKESAIRGFEYGSIIDVRKNISLDDDKRVWKNKFSFDTMQDSEAINVTNSV